MKGIETRLQKLEKTAAPELPARFVQSLDVNGGTLGDGTSGFWKDTLDGTVYTNAQVDAMAELRPIIEVIYKHAEVSE